MYCNVRNFPNESNTGIDMNSKRPDPPNYEDNLFHTIGELLQKRIPVAVLVDAIEKHGICTYDQYGRYGFTDDKGKARALHWLEIYYKWESTAPEERDREDPRSPIERWGCVSENEYEHFGWSTKVLPNFDNIQLNQGAKKEETPIERSERLRARIKEEKAKGTKAFLRLVASEENISTTRLKQITSIKKTNFPLIP